MLSPLFFSFFSMGCSRTKRRHRGSRIWRNLPQYLWTGVSSEGSEDFLRREGGKEQEQMLPDRNRRRKFANYLGYVGRSIRTCFLHQIFKKMVNLGMSFGECCTFCSGGSCNDPVFPLSGFGRRRRRCCCRCCCLLLSFPSFLGSRKIGE